MISSSTSRGQLPRITQRGFTLVELMVAMAISLFLLFGLAKVLQNVRRANANSQELAQLQDTQRFAFAVLNDVIQTGGYFPLPVLYSEQSLLAYSGGAAWQTAAQGQPFYGNHTTTTAPDYIGVRYMTQGGDGVLMCDGTTNGGAPGAGTIYNNVFWVVPPGTNNSPPGYLACQVTAGGVVGTVAQLVNGVQNIQIWYGVNRSSPSGSYNIDTYLTADQMCSACTSNDWDNVSSVKVILTFTNPLYYNNPSQPQSITMTRIISVMGHSGDHS